MSLTIKNWKKQVEEMPSDAAVCITYIQLSEFNGYGLYVSIIPPGEANTGHYHRENRKNIISLKVAAFLCHSRFAC